MEDLKNDFSSLDEINAEIASLKLRLNDLYQLKYANHLIKRADRKCCFCGSNNYYAKGFCRNCYARYLKYGTPEYRRTFKIVPVEKVPETPWRIKLLRDIFGEIQIPLDIDESVDYAIQTLSEREQYVLKMRYEEKLTLDKCAELLGVSRERIRQIQQKATRKLMHTSRRRYLLFGITGVKEIEQKKEQEFEEIRLKYEHLIGHLKSVQLEDLDLSTRSYHTLSRSGIKTAYDIIKYMELHPLTRIPKLGKRSEDEIINKLELYGVKIQTNNKGVIDEYGISD